MSDMVYSEEEVESAPFGHVRFAGTNVDVVTYRINDRDLCVLMNKDGVCVYRATLIGALDPSVRPFQQRIHCSRTRSSCAILQARVRRWKSDQAASGNAERC